MARNPKATAASKRAADKRADDRSDLVEKVIQSVEANLRSRKVKATLADFIRLLHLQKELQLDRPREIKITWVETAEEESVSE
jgi:hypothetical protein